MKLGLNYCADCGCDLSVEGRDPHDPDRCVGCVWWNKKELTDVQHWLRDSHIGATAPLTQPQTR